MAEVHLPAGSIVSAMHIEPWHPGQIVLVSPFTGSAQVLNRGYASWRGSAEFAPRHRADTEVAQSLEAFFASLGGAANWVALPLIRPTIERGNRATVSAVVSATDGLLTHRLSRPLEGLRRGHWLEAQSAAPRIFIVRSLVRASVTLDPQLPLAVGTTLGPATRIRARARGRGGRAASPRHRGLGPVALRLAGVHLTTKQQRGNDMTWTAKGKLIQANGFKSATRYAALSIGNVELSGHGYSRGAVTAADMDVDAASAQITINKHIVIYTPTDGNAQDATHLSFWDKATGGNQLLAPVAFADIAAPVEGQAVRIKSGMTIDP